MVVFWICLLLSKCSGRLGRAGLGVLVVVALCGFVIREVWVKTEGLRVRQAHLLYIKFAQPEQKRPTTIVHQCVAIKQ